jgi:ribonuclease R
MLLANVCAARFLLKHGLPGLYRVHEPPADDKLTELRNFLGLLGIRLQNTQKALEARDFNELVHQIRHRPDFLPLQYTLLRTLTQARYQPTNLGHFGLAYPAYTHFTSPIRRYPDLIVHRAIRYLLNYQDPAGKAYSLEALEALGIHTSAQERKADEASRLVMNLLKARYIEKHLGETFTGTISGITEFGFFVTLDDLLVDGLVHVKNLKDDYYRFQANRMVLEGEKSRQIFSLGQTVQVTIAKVDTSSGKIDFELQTLKPSKSVRSADPHSSKKAPEASGKGSKKPSKKDAEPSGQGPKRKTNRKK